MNRAMTRPIRIVLAKAGLDAHERGMHVISHGLRDHGFEVIVLPLRRTPAEIVASAVQEDADVIGISSLAGSHLAFVRALSAEITARNAEAILVIGGVIPASDHDELRRHGVVAIFPQGSMVKDISAQLRGLVPDLDGGR
jgi:methylmalonyl-CoA mutase, C-terminal domain